MVVAFLVLILVIILVAVTNKDDSPNNADNRTVPHNGASHFDGDHDFDDDDEENDYDEDEYLIPPIYHKNSASRKGGGVLFDRLMDSSSPEGTFFKGLEDEGYDVEDW